MTNKELIVYQTGFPMQLDNITYSLTMKRLFGIGFMYHKIKIAILVFFMFYILLLLHQDVIMVNSIDRCGFNFAYT